MLYRPFPRRLDFELIPKRRPGDPPDGVRIIRRPRTPTPRPAISEHGRP